MSNIKDRIKELRKEYGYTQESLSKALGLNAKSSIANYENGSNAPSDNIKLKMCKLFNCSMDYLMGITSYKNPRNDLETALYKLDLTEAEFDEMLSLFLSDENDNLENILHSSNKLSIACQYCLDLIDDYNTFADKNIIIDDYFNKLTKIISSLDRSKIIHNYNKNNSKMFLIPILGKIAAGQPILAEEYLEGYLPVDPNIYGMRTPDDYFYLKVSGESMNLKIHNGDYALIHKQDYAEDGDIVVALVNGDDEATLKRYKKISNEIIMLEPMSTYPMEPIVVNLKETKFQIIGKAIGQFGKF